MINSIFLRY